MESSRDSATYNLQGKVIDRLKKILIKVKGQVKRYGICKDNFSGLADLYNHWGVLSSSILLYRSSSRFRKLGLFIHDWLYLCTIDASVKMLPIAYDRYQIHPTFTGPAH